MTVIPTSLPVIVATVLVGSSAVGEGREGHKRNREGEQGAD